MSEDRARLSSLKNKSYIREIELKWSLTFEMKISAVVDNILIVQYVSRVGIQDRFKQTDQALEDVPTWPNVSMCHIYSHIHHIYHIHHIHRPRLSSADRPVSHRAEDSTNRNHRSGRCRGLQVQTEIPDSA